MICKKCKIGFVPSKGLVNYCSLSCRNSNPHNENSREKLSKSRLQYNEKLRRLGYCPGKHVDIKSEEERKRKISLTMKKNPKSGGLREGSGRGVKTWYESEIAGRIYLRSSYELIYVKWLDQNKTNWRQNLTGFRYKHEEVEHLYYPDFYLVDEDRYIEVKGYRTERDESKWRDFPYKLEVLYESEIRILEKELK